MWWLYNQKIITNGFWVRFKSSDATAQQKQPIKIVGRFEFEGEEDFQAFKKKLRETFRTISDDYITVDSFDEGGDYNPKQLRLFIE